MVLFRKRQLDHSASPDSGIVKEALQQAEKARREHERARREAEEKALREAPARAAQKARDAERRQKEEAERARIENEKKRRVASLKLAAREFSIAAKKHRLPRDAEFGWKLYKSCSCEERSSLEPTGQVIMGDTIMELVYQYYGHHLEIWVTKKGELVENNVNCKQKRLGKYSDVRVESVEQLVGQIRTIMIDRLAQVL